MEGLSQRADLFDLLFREYGDRIDDADRLEAETRRLRAWHAFWAASHLFDRGDVEGCRDLLALAAKSYPRLRSSPAWFRLQAKRLMGVRAWSLLKPAVGRLRRSFRASRVPFGASR